MLRNSKFQLPAVLAVGALLGYLAATGYLNPFALANAASQSREPARVKPVDPAGSAESGCCCENADRAKLLALADTKAPGKKPNILVIFGDDIGIPQISAYTQGLMGYRTPNIDRIAKEGALF